MPISLRFAMGFFFAMLFPMSGAEWNALILEEIQRMPRGGGYSVTAEASRNFRAAVELRGGLLRVQARTACPSYCSSATYLLLLNVLGRLQEEGKISLPLNAWEALFPKPQPDGHGVWGRWNANGPGTARLFAELGAGSSFVDFRKAQPGDFLKIFWKDAVGKLEHGHLVVFLGLEQVGETEMVRFWSSNKPDGYGEKSVPRSKVARAIFSRLQNPEAFAKAAQLPKVDTYLAGLLKKESSFAEACRLSQVVDY